MINFNVFLIIYKTLFVHITSSDLSKLYCIGFLIGIFFTFQILSGILLSFIYSNNFVMCWYSIISITDFEAGFLIRSIHITGTSFIYLTIYIHMFKVFFQIILHNSAYIVWLIGIIIYFLTVITAFIGYVLPLTQMSYWGLTVFSNILSTIPFIGKLLCFWVWGSEFIQDFTLIKVHSLHIILPLVLAFLIVFHLYFLHFFMSSDGFFDRFTFYYEKNLFVYYFFLRDFLILIYLLNIYVYFIYINWIFVFHEESFEIVDTMKTSDKIIPEWFFLTFFGFIKAVPDKLGGICVLIIFVISFINIIFYVLLLFKYITFNLYIFYFTWNIIITLYYIGILSTNVTLLFPFIFELQALVICIIVINIIKII